ncbi:hypothetical protein KMW28_12965 [Flammeovirga yaeyamensis]|uniref:Uncharacterized protein n=1 Tax=Flammeovirga yaeyamensis TaxID=367791 RepID=A0AAX1N3T4_9BACT|nr:hypothetical protein [Flammeovirga yaeyamensis]MBB3695918.1 hypothetical protein [Flammeovirga yaeyamensis]NMF34607.1 hypothetical protein [Flammeovirga yaeyamensis]QWG00563.1 hypothetical protein KMW28_12965 [Flammeovirga yaeyamensis]
MKLIQLFALLLFVGLGVSSQAQTRFKISEMEAYPRLTEIEKAHFAGLEVDAIVNKDNIELSFITGGDDKNPFINTYDFREKIQGEKIYTENTSDGHVMVMITYKKGLFEKDELTMRQFSPNGDCIGSFVFKEERN